MSATVLLYYYYSRIFCIENAFIYFVVNKYIFALGYVFNVEVEHGLKFYILNNKQITLN